MKALVSMFLVLVVIVSSVVFVSASGVKKEQKNQVVVHFFWGEGCPYCQKQKVFLNNIKKKYPVVINEYEVWNNSKNRELFIEMTKKHNILPRGVPITFIGSKYFLGFSEEIGVDMEKHIKMCLKNKNMC